MTVGTKFALLFVSSLIFYGISIHPIADLHAQSAAASNPVQAQDKTKAAKDLTPEEVIKAFSAKETEFYEAWIQYAYQQDAEVRVLSVNGNPSRERMRLVSDVIFKDNGTREVRQVERRGELKSVTFTKEDEEVLNNIQPFSLTAKELSLYDLKYEGKEKVDELTCYVFSVKPKNTKGGRMYFSGKIWVDDEDLQIVRTVGKPVPEKANQRFPEFETLRQFIDNKYWFPVWTHADSVLDFSSGRIRVEETITYSDYKRFDSKATIRFGK
jgi:outer membrane lipoprotein-sorting protein